MVPQSPPGKAASMGLTGFTLSASLPFPRAHFLDVCISREYVEDYVVVPADDGR